MGPKESASGVRALRAIVIALLVGVLGLASVGFAGEPSTEPLTLVSSEDVRFGVPAPHVGDKAMYAVEWDLGFGAPGGHGHGEDDEHTHDAHGGSGHGGEHGLLAKSTERAGGGHHAHYVANQSTFNFEWLELGELYDRNGAHHYTNRLVFDTESGTAETRSSFASILELDQASRALVGMTQTQTMGFGYGTAFTGSSSTTTKTANWTTVLDPLQSDAHGRSIPCGASNPLQGVERNLSSPVTFNEHCASWVAFDKHVTGTGVYVLDGLGTDDDLRSVRLVRDPVASGDDGNASGVVVAAYTFREDIPYPTKTETVDLDSGGNATWELRAFVRGDRPLGMSASTQPPLPPLAMVPVPEWGIEDAGVDHPYPLRAAWQDALLDPRTGLRLFLEEHDDVYVSFATFEQIERDTGWEDAWTFVVTDREEHLTVCQARDADAIPGAPVTPATSVAANGQCPQFEIEQPQEYSPGLRPSALSLQTAWTFLSDLLGTDERPLDYGVTVLDTGTSTPYEAFTIGTAKRYGKEIEPALGSVASYEVRGGGTEVRFSADGRLEAFSVYVEDRRYGPAEDEGGHIPMGARPGPASSTTTIERVIPASFAPSATEASAVGGMALGAAALYWLWPWLNQVLFAPLFSRIQKPKVLDHERRQRIAAAVAAEPGVHFEELRRRLDLGRGALRHHLQMLVDNGVVGVRKAGGYTCYYPTGEVDVRAVDAQAAARSPTAQQILQAWQADPQASGSDLAERLGMSRQTVHYHQKRLRSAGLAPL